MMIRFRRVAALVVAGVAGTSALTGCGSLFGSKLAQGSVPDSITVTSPAFREGAQIPTRFACAAYSGQGKTPPLRWSGASSGTRAFALVIDDPDAPGGAYVHWILFNIDPTANELLEGVIPQHAEQAKNTGGKVGYAPPCPPQGQVHRYRFTMYALSQAVPLRQGADLNGTLSAIAARTIARGRMTVQFGRP